MKKILFFVFGVYTLIFVGGYAAVHIKGKEKVKGFCEMLMAEESKKIWFVPVFAPGEGNACLDLGYYPVKGK